MELNGDNSDKLVADYIQRVLEIRRQQGDDILTQDFLDEVAASVGIEKDEALILNTFQKHYNLGVAFGLRKDWPKAYEAFDIASDLFPNHILALTASMLATAVLWERSGDEKYKAEALDYAHRILHQDPHHKLAIKALPDIAHRTNFQRIKTRWWGISWQQKSLDHLRSKAASIIKSPPRAKSNAAKSKVTPPTTDLPPTTTDSTPPTPKSKLTKADKEKIIKNSQAPKSNLTLSPYDLFVQQRNLKNKNMSQVFYQIIAEGNTTLAEIAIAKGANVNGIVNTDGMFPLLFALANQDNKLVEFLIHKGANINALHEQTRFPIITFAIGVDNARALKVFLENGLDPHLTFSTYTLTSYAELCNARKCLLILEEYTKKP